MKPIHSETFESAIIPPNSKETLGKQLENKLQVALMVFVTSIRPGKDMNPHIATCLAKIGEIINMIPVPQYQIGAYGDDKEFTKAFESGYKTGYEQAHKNLLRTITRITTKDVSTPSINTDSAN